MRNVWIVKNNFNCLLKEEQGKRLVSQLLLVSEHSREAVLVQSWQVFVCAICKTKSSSFSTGNHLSVFLLFPRNYVLCN